MSRRSVVRFNLEDGDIKTLNRLKKYKLQNVEAFENGNISFSVGLKHKSEVTRLLGKKSFVAKENTNIFSFLNFFYTRFTIVVTAMVCLISFLVFEQFVFRVNLQGLHDEEYTQVAQYLQTHGIKKMTPKRVARRPNLAHEIVNEFPFVAAASVYLRGSKVTINVIRADNVIPNIPTGDIISTHDGVIGDLVVFSGTPIVTVGDVVRKGDVLVTGARPTAIITIVNGTEVICVINNTMV